MHRLRERKAVAARIRPLASVHGSLVLAEFARLRERGFTVSARMRPLASVHGSLVLAEFARAPA
jgi:hypothetical protein